MQVLFILLGIMVGFLLIFLKTFNMILGEEIGVYYSSFMNHFVGGVMGVILVGIFWSIGLKSELNIAKIPWYAYTGGISGAFFVILSNYTMPKVKILTSTILLLGGQFISSLIMDLFFFKIETSWNKIIGALLIIGAVLIYSKKDKKSIIDNDCLKAS